MYYYPETNAVISLLLYLKWIVRIFNLRKVIIPWIFHRDGFQAETFVFQPRLFSIFRCWKIETRQKNMQLISIQYSYSYLSISLLFKLSTYFCRINFCWPQAWIRTESGLFMKIYLRKCINIQGFFPWLGTGPNCFP